MCRVACPRIRIARLVIASLIAAAAFLVLGAVADTAPSLAAPSGCAVSPDTNVITTGQAIYVFFTNHSDSALTFKEVYGKDPGETVEGEFEVPPKCTIGINETATIISVPGFLEGTQFSVVYELDNHSTIRMTYENPEVGKGKHEEYMRPGYSLYTTFHSGEIDEFKQTFTLGCECDGIPDDWKVEGVTINSDGKPVAPGTPGGVFIDLPHMGVSLDRPNILVQMDWMEDATHHRNLVQGAITKVIEAFNNDPVTYPGINGSAGGATRPGITLIVDNGPHSTITPGGPEWGDLSKAKAFPWKEGFLTGERKTGYDSKHFQELLTQNFVPTRRVPIFRYAASVGGITSTNLTDTTSGLTPEGRYGFIVSLGLWANGGTEMEQAGTFMHELGHVLGLKHGGEDSINDKPSYPSVMNYVYQTRGVPLPGRPIDYSREREPSLDETTLMEKGGISLGPNLLKYGVQWLCPNGGASAATFNLAEVDWNCDGTIPDGGTGFDVNGEQTEQEEKKDERKKLQVLTGTEKSDWERIDFRGGGVGTGNAAENEVTVPAVVNDEELTTQIAASLRIPSKITYTGAVSANYHQPFTASAKLVDPSTEDTPVGEASIAFNLGPNPTESCTATTDASGIASCTIIPAQKAGTYTTTASFGGNNEYLSTSTAQSFTIARAMTTLSYNGPFHVANGSPATMTGTLRENGSTPPSPAGQSVTFTLGSGSSAQSCSGTVAASGNVQCTIASVNQPDSSTFALSVDAAFAGDTFYEPSSTPPATVQLLYYTGRAYGSSFTLFRLPALITADTGIVTTAQEKTVLKSGTSLSFGYGQLTAPTASVSTGGGSVTATASGSSFSLSGLFVPTIRATKMTATSHTSCAGSTGSSTISSITINGTSMTVPNRPPNTVIPLPFGGSVRLNQQIPAEGGHGLTVNALHVSIPGLIDYVQSSATTGIRNCP